MASINDFVTSVDYITETANIVSNLGLSIDSEEKLNSYIPKLLEETLSETDFSKILADELLIEDEKIPQVIALIKIRMYPYLNKTVDEKVFDVYYKRVTENPQLEKNQIEDITSDEEDQVLEKTVQTPQKNYSDPHNEEVSTKTALMLDPKLEPMLIPGEEVHNVPVPIRKHSEEDADVLTTDKDSFKPISISKQVPIKAMPPSTKSVLSQSPVVNNQKPASLWDKNEFETEIQHENIDRDALLDAIENPVPTVSIKKSTIPEPTLKNPGVPLHEQKLNQPTRIPRQEQKITDPYRESID